MTARAFLIGLALLGARPAAADVPRWLVDAAARPTPASAETCEAVVLHGSQDVVVQASGRIVTTERRVVRILHRDGRDRAVMRVVYRSDAGRVRDVRTWYQPPGGRLREQTTQLLDRALVDNTLYSEARVQVASIAEQVEPGSVFAYEWVAENRSIFAQFHRILQDNLPTVLSSFSVEVPRDWRIDATALNRDSIPRRIEAHRSTWELRDLPGLVIEPFQPALTSLAPAVAVTCLPPSGQRTPIVSFGSWSDLTRWASEICEPMGAPSPELAARSRSLVAGARSELDSIRAIGSFVQKIEYAAIELGVERGGGYRPRAAAEVFARSYGDCKDKANLMRTMLGTIGVPSWLVLVHATDPEFARGSWPSPLAFNHCIIAVRWRGSGESLPIAETVPLGRILFFDPTDPATLLGDLPAAMQGGLCAIVDPRSTTPVRLPELPIPWGGSEQRFDLTIDELGKGRVRIRERASGQSASIVRRQLRSEGAGGIRRALESEYATRQSGARVTTFEIQDDTLRGRVSMAAELELPQAGQLMQGRLMTVRPFVLSSWTGEAGSATARRTPYVLQAVALRETVAVELPFGFRVDEMIEPIEIEKAFGTYRARAEAGDGKLLQVRSLDLRRGRVPVDQAEDVRAFLRAIRASENAPAVLVRE
jgi:hypothetical protein